MSTVALTIGPKSYSVACADGEEAHVAMLGAMVAERYERLGTARAPLEAQNLLFAALFLADELSELSKRAQALQPQETPAAAMASDQSSLADELAELQRENARLQSALFEAQRAPAPQADLFGGEGTQALAERLETLADGAEALASTLEASLVGS